MMSCYNSTNIHTQNELLLRNLMDFYKNKDYLCKMMRIINGESKISLRIVDWFVTNYSKKYYIVYELCKDSRILGTDRGDNGSPNAGCVPMRFKVYNDYKLKLKAYSKKRFDPFCRWERITIPYDEANYMETTIGQLNFFKWAIENKIVEYIENNYVVIEGDMNTRNSTSKRKESLSNSLSIQGSADNGKTRKKREELSISACKCIKKEVVNIVVKFS
jgi:hypothetical protein